MANNGSGARSVSASLAFLAASILLATFVNSDPQPGNFGLFLSPKR